MHYTAHQPELQDASARATRLFWIICLLGWAAMLTVTASSLFVAGFRPFRLVVEMTLALWLPYVAFTPLVFMLVRRFPITSASWRSAIFIHLLASIIFVVVCEGVFLCAVSVLGPAVQKSYAERQAANGGETNASPQSNPLFPAPPAPGLPLPSVRLAGVKAAANLPLYWVIVAFAQALLATARLREREQQAAELTAHLTQAQLAGLRTQLQPHFLFNTLNSISALIPNNAKLANEMVLNLSDLLRMTLRDPQHGEIPLSEELDLLGHYVEIQKFRFGERLVFNLVADDNTLNFPVPPMLLQPLVENAIRYGVELSEQPEQITVRARLAEQILSVEVTNTFHGLAEELSTPKNSTGVGLANTRARLAGLYGAAQSFVFGALPDGGFRVQIKIPQRSSPTASHEN
jgi:signal transduction histidine kinase